MKHYLYGKEYRIQNLEYHAGWSLTCCRESISHLMEANHNCRLMVYRPSSIRSQNLEYIISGFSLHNIPEPQMAISTGEMNIFIKHPIDANKKRPVCWEFPSGFVLQLYIHQEHRRKPKQSIFIIFFVCSRAIGVSREDLEQLSRLFIPPCDPGGFLSYLFLLSGSPFFTTHYYVRRFCL